MRSLVFLAILAACAEAPSNKAQMASSNAENKARGDAPDVHSDAVPSAAATSQDSPNANAAAVAETERVSAPSQINGALLSCKIEDKQLENDVVVECLMVDSSNKPLVPNAINLDVDFTVQATAKAKILSDIEILPNANGDGVAYIFHAPDPKIALADVGLSSFKATLTVKNDAKISGVLVSPGKNVIMDFAKSMTEGATKMATDISGTFIGGGKGFGKEAE